MLHTLIMSTRRKAKAQRSLWEGVVDVDVRSLWEPWMVEADRLLEDEQLIDTVFDAQGQRHTHSATRGRAQTPAETTLRLFCSSMCAAGASTHWSVR